MKKSVVILGAGMVGKAIAIDLGKKYHVTSVDINQEELDLLKQKPEITVQQKDLQKPGAIKEVIKGADLVIGALPGFLGFDAAKEVIKNGKTLIDISFFPEDPFPIDELAKKNGVSVVIDCGIAPGMSNIILGYWNQHMKIDTFRCYVGGLPVVREWPFEYKAVFSPIDVIEEYTRPARIVENGFVVTREALSDNELIDIEGIGTLEACNSDGLRSLIKTMDIPNMVEKTLRYPGTLNYVKALRHCGFFNYEEVDVKGNKIRPIDVTEALLFPKWKLKEDEEDLTIMKIFMKGEKDDEPFSCEYLLLDRYDTSSKTISMARTTGYTCTAVANLLLDNKITQKGMLPPEFIGTKKENFDFVLQYLKERNVNYMFKQHVL